MRRTVAPRSELGARLPWGSAQELPTHAQQTHRAWRHSGQHPSDARSRGSGRVSARASIVPRGAGRVRAEVASWLAMGDFGSIRRLPRGSIYVEFPGEGRRKRRIWSLRVGADATIPFTEE